MFLYETEITLKTLFIVGSHRGVSLHIFETDYRIVLKKKSELLEITVIYWLNHRVMGS